MANEKKDVKLTNFQVPRSPEMQRFDAMAQAPEIDLNSNKYRDVGKVHDTKTVQDVAERMMQKREAATGIAINAPPEAAPQVNLKGVVDERPKDFWIPPRIGKR